MALEEEAFDTGHGEPEYPEEWLTHAQPQYVLASTLMPAPAAGGVAGEFECLTLKDSVDSDYEVTVAALRVRADALSTVAVVPSGRLDTAYEAMQLPAWDRVGAPLDGQLISAEIMETPSALVRRFAAAPPADGQVYAFHDDGWWP